MERPRRRWPETAAERPRMARNGISDTERPMRRGEKGKAVVPDERLVLLWQGPVHRTVMALTERRNWRGTVPPVLRLR